MAKKVPNGYMCLFCETVYPTLAKADSCRDSHEIIYVPMTVTELNRLINGLFIGDVTIVPDSLLDTLRKIQRKSVTDGFQKKVQGM
jgi:hypothetical protein